MGFTNDLLQPGRLTWNIIIEVGKIIFLSFHGWFECSMLIFQGVTGMILQVYIWPIQTNCWKISITVHLKKVPFLLDGQYQKHHMPIAMEHACMAHGWKEYLYTKSVLYHVWLNNSAVKCGIKVTNNKETYVRVNYRFLVGGFNPFKKY